MTQTPVYLDSTQTDEPAILTRLDAGQSLGLSLNQGDWEQDVFTSVAYELGLAATLPQNLLAQAFILTASGSYLDARGADLNLPRKPATAAVWTCELTGTAGSTVPQGQLVATSPTEGAAQISFYTTAAATIPSEETTVTASVQAVVAGSSGNVAVGAIALFVGSTPAGISSVGNTVQTVAGADVEQDGPLYGTSTTYYRGRLLQAIRNPGVSGNQAYYTKYALAVPDVGNAAVERVWAGPGTVGIALLDQDGNPASAGLVQSVENALINPWRFTWEAGDTSTPGLSYGGYGVSSDGTTPDSAYTATAKLVSSSSGAGTVTLTGLNTLAPLVQPGVYRVRLLVQVSSTSGASSLLTAQVYDTAASAACPISPTSSTPCTSVWTAAELPTSFGASTFNPLIFGYVELDFFWNGYDDVNLILTRDTADTTTTLWVGTVNVISTFQNDSENVGVSLLGDWVSVWPATAVPVDLAVELEYAEDADEPTVQAAVEAAFTTYLANLAFQPVPQNTVYFGGVVAALMAVPGVVGYVPSSLLLNSAQDDVSIGQLDVATVGTLSVS